MKKYIFEKKGLSNWEDFFSPERLKKRWESNKEIDNNIVSNDYNILIKELNTQLSALYNDKKEILEFLLTHLKELYDKWNEKKDNKIREEILTIIQYIEDLVYAFDIEKRMNNPSY